MKLESHATVLQVPDVGASLEWFRDALGFEVRPWADGDRGCEIRLHWTTLSGRQIGSVR